MKILKCEAGNKQCGKRCVPKAHKCKAEKGNEPKEGKSTKAQKSDKAIMEEDIKKGGLHPGVKVSIAVAGVTLATAGVLAIVGVSKTLGEADLEGGATLDNLKPGDVVRKPCNIGGLKVAHYAVYAGPDPENEGQLLFLEVHGRDEVDRFEDMDAPKGERGKYVDTIGSVGLKYREVSPEDLAIWEKVEPPPGVYKQFGDNSEEYINLFVEMAGKIEQAEKDGVKAGLDAAHKYSLTGISCESFANALAYGVPFSRQADSANVIARSLIQKFDDRSDGWTNEKALRATDGIESRRDFFEEEMGMKVPDPGIFGLNDQKIRDAQAAMKIAGVPDGERRDVMKGVVSQGLMEDLGLTKLARGLERAKESAINKTATDNQTKMLNMIFADTRLDDATYDKLLNLEGDLTPEELKKFGGSGPMIEFYAWLQNEGYFSLD